MLKKLQFIIINAIETDISHITVSEIYCPPKHTIPTIQYTDFLKRLTFIIYGDLNTKHTNWGSRYLGIYLMTYILNNKSRHISSYLRPTDYSSPLASVLSASPQVSKSPKC